MDKIGSTPLGSGYGQALLDLGETGGDGVRQGPIGSIQASPRRRPGASPASASRPCRRAAWSRTSRRVGSAGCLNNIEGLTMALGLGSGLAGRPHHRWGWRRWWPVPRSRRSSPRSAPPRKPMNPIEGSPESASRNSRTSRPGSRSRPSNSTSPGTSSKPAQEEPGEHSTPQQNKQSEAEAASGKAIEHRNHRDRARARRRSPAKVRGRHGHGRLTATIPGPLARSPGARRCSESGRATIEAARGGADRDQSTGRD
jgi:hypothetical protein